MIVGALAEKLGVSSVILEMISFRHAPDTRPCPSFNGVDVRAWATLLETGRDARMQRRLVAHGQSR